MTTNAGASDMAKEAIGFGREGRDGEDEDAIKRLFTPEFRNRLDATIAFAGLTPEIVGRVVEKFVMQLEAQLGDRDVTIELSEDATKWLIRHGYDEQMGARPMARLIQENIKKALADEVLFGKLKAGGHVRVIATTDETGSEKLAFEYLEGPVTPKPDKIPEAGASKPKRRPPRRKPSGGRGNDGPSSPRGSVPKVPLVKV
jgi:ATP-dependent Clp protease ATP-binding subunit ClpA